MHRMILISVANPALWCINQSWETVGPANETIRHLKSHSARCHRVIAVMNKNTLLTIDLDSFSFSSSGIPAILFLSSRRNAFLASWIATWAIFTTKENLRATAPRATLSTNIQFPPGVPVMMWCCGTQSLARIPRFAKHELWRRESAYFWPIVLGNLRDVHGYKTGYLMECNTVSVWASFNRNVSTDRLLIIQ